MTYETKIHSLIIKPANESIYSEQATTITVQDDGGGCFYELNQDRGDGGNKGIQTTPEEWPHIVAAVSRLMAEWEATEL